ncbi:MAG: ABC transporter ATP-binding protein [Candidatus Thorarchaeota archaeon]|jgi:branched-chain amino acid transport system ATP-binding protein
MLLEVSGVVSGYVKGIDILQGFSLNVEEKTLVGLIGGNGAGKSTLLKTIYGFLKPTGGQILFDNEDVSKRHTSDLANMGISYVPQSAGFFPQLNIDTNLTISLWCIRNQKHEVERSLEKIYSEFPRLDEKRKDKASSLSGGEAKMLELAKGLIMEPRLILIDEPTAGLAPMIAKQVYVEIAALKERGVSVLLVDQNIKAAVEIADYTYMMQLGRNAAEGPKEVFQERLSEILKDTLLGTNGVTASE